MELLAICPTVLGLRCSHRQRQNLHLFIEFAHEFGVAHMSGQDISHVLAHGDPPIRGFLFDDVVDDAIGPRHDLSAITFVCAARLGHNADCSSTGTVT